MAELRLVQVPDGLRPPVQVPGVQRRPATILRAEPSVGGDHMGVEVRVPRPRGPVPEPGSHKTLSRQHVRASPAAPDSSRLHLHHREGGADRCLMRGDDGGGGVWGPERPQERHRLRGAERQVEPRYLRRRPAPGQRGTRGRVGVDQERSEVVTGDLARESEPGS